MAFAYFQPDTLDEASVLAARYQSDASFVAGGTDLVIQMRRRTRRPAQIIDIQQIGALQGIDCRLGQVSLGALTTHRAIERFPAFQTSLRGLIESAEVIGGHQIRNVGTVGGNVCNASPAADLLPILLALNAQVYLSGASSSRQLELGDFLRGPGQTARRHDEILTKVSFVPPGPRSATAFIKMGRRRAMEISIISAAAAIRLDPSGRCTDARLAIGAAAPTAIRLPKAENMLRGQAVTAELLKETGTIAASAIAPLSDVRASAEYRRHLARIIVPRSIQRCLDRIVEFTP